MKTKVDWIIAIVVFILFCIPLVLYVKTFGGNLSDDHTRWSGFGDFLTGIYSPLIAFLAYLVLVRQSNNQFEMDKYHYDTSFISRSVSDIDYYLAKIEPIIDSFYETSGQQPCCVALAKVVNQKTFTIEEMKSPEFKVLVNNFIDENRKLCVLWDAMLTNYGGLIHIDEIPYMRASSSTLLKTQALLSNYVCRTLDAALLLQHEKFDPDDMLFLRFFEPDS